MKYKIGDELRIKIKKSNSTVWPISHVGRLITEGCIIKIISLYNNKIVDVEFDDGVVWKIDCLEYEIIEDDEDTVIPLMSKDEKVDVDAESGVKVKDYNKLSEIETSSKLLSDKNKIIREQEKRITELQAAVDAHGYTIDRLSQTSKDQIILLDTQAEIIKNQEKDIDNLRSKKLPKLEVGKLDYEQISLAKLIGSDNFELKVTK